MPARDPSHRSSATPPPASPAAVGVRAADMLREYNRLLEADADRTVRDMRLMARALAAAGVNVNGTLAQTFLKPDLISLAEHDLLGRTIPPLMACIERAVRIFDERPDLRPMFGLEDSVASLIQLEPALPLRDGVSINAVPVARLDGFLNRGQLQFIEFNVDSPAGAGYADVIEDLIVGTATCREFLAGGVRIERVHRRQRLLDALLSHWRAWCELTGGASGAGGETPRLVIADWHGVATAPEFTILADYFRERGLDCEVADPREFTLGADGALQLGGRPVDMVCRRALVPELAARRDEIQPLLKAISAGRVCLANPLRSRIASSKALMELLTDPLHDDLFDASQNAVRHEALPWTRVLRDREVVFDAAGHSLLELLRNRRREFVIKPGSGSRGVGVVIGRETDADAWDAIITQAAARGDHVAQVWVPAPEKTMPVAHLPAGLGKAGVSGRIAEVDAALAGRITMVSRKANLGPFAFGGAYGGAIARLSNDSIINVALGSGLVPTVAVGPTHS